MADVVVMLSSLRARWVLVLGFLPRGSTLPPDVWWQRHRGILTLLWLHVPVTFVFAIVQGTGLLHAALEAAAVGSLATMATLARRHVRLSTVITSVGLMTAAAVFVHLSDGLIEMHFHYFVLMAVITLYQDWRPFLVAIGHVVLQHGLMGVLSADAVYNHPAAIAQPWKWAAIHGGFVLAMSVVGVITWRLNEALLDAATAREKALAEAQELAKLGSWEDQPDTEDAHWSDEMYRLFGVDRSFQTTRDAVLSLIHPDDRAAWENDIGRARAGGEPHDLDFRALLPDGTERWFHGRGARGHAVPGAAAVMTGTVQDITERRHAENTLRASQAELQKTMSLLHSTLESTADGILVVDTEGHITSYNEQFARMWRIPLEILRERGDEAVMNSVLGQLADPDGFVAKVVDLYSLPDAESYDTIDFADGRVFERLSKPQRVDGRVVGRVWSFRDMTERQNLEAELAHQAFHDSLTGLANSALFRDRLDHALSRQQRSGVRLAVLFLDVDNFKNVNDSMGHTAGNELLVAVTERLLGSLRAADTAARLGGDEFAILAEDITDDRYDTELAARVLDAMRQPFSISGQEVYAPVSIGIAHSAPGIDGDQLLRHADLAMYTAKRLGKDRCEQFVPTMHTEALNRIDMEGHLRHARRRDELRLHYQPIVDLNTGRIVGAEALVRWQHPERGLLPPALFIPLAEETGLIGDIGEWVLDQACREARRWQTTYGSEAPRISVNLSTRQLRDANIAGTVRDCLARTELPAERLTLEITESAMIDDPTSALSRLSALKTLGVQLALDDFGTGYSSLTYLQQLPIDVLKIDRAFVEGIDGGPEDSALARAIVHLAKSLDLPTVAEGVQNQAQVERLRATGCEMAQGYYMSRPVDAEQMTHLIRCGPLLPPRPPDSVDDHDEASSYRGHDSSHIPRAPDLVASPAIGHRSSA